MDNYANFSHVTAGDRSSSLIVSECIVNHGSRYRPDRATSGAPEIWKFGAVIAVKLVSGDGYHTDPEPARDLGTTFEIPYNAGTRLCEPHC